MKAFHTIAIPHKDILEGRLTMDVFAADLEQVCRNKGPDEYRDAETFFEKTYLTEGLKNLLDRVERRLKGKGGESVIQLQTPFGGGKTHALIAMYHKAGEWKVKTVVLVGTELSAEATLWGEIERQLTGEVSELDGNIAPGKNRLRKILEPNQPVLILMDEVLEYVTKAAGVRVEESTLAAQTIAFMQELTETAGALGKVSLVVTLPSSITEHYGESAERLFQTLQKVSGRMEKIFTPVQDNEIPKVIRRRLFSHVDEGDARGIVTEFIKYANQERILPRGIEPSEYRVRFLDAYPFMPEVIDVLYQRWGTIPTFQRTRGVLRLLSLVIYSLRSSSRPYISLADFDLDDQEIRQELIKYTGSQGYDGVIDADITSKDSGARKVDSALGGSYQGLNLGRRTATTIFLYSFSGGHERGTALEEIKRSATTLDNPASVVVEAADKMEKKLFYLQTVDGKYFFDNLPNLNLIRITRMVNITEADLVALEQEVLKGRIRGSRFKVFVWEEDPSRIPDSEEPKLVILQKKDEDTIRKILDTKGRTPRVYGNTLFFLYPQERERVPFLDCLKRKIADESIDRDPHLNLSDEQKKQIKRDLKKLEAESRESIRKLYQVVAIPVQKGFKEESIGVPTYGEEKPIDEEVFEWLRSKGEILVKIAPVVLKEKYLSGREYVSTEQIYQSSLRTPGEVRPVDRSVFEEGIAEGVRTGLFGLGELEDDQTVCRYFKERPTVALSGKEVLLSEALCRKNPPPKVPEIRATQGNQTVTVEWQGVPEATSYNLYWSEESGVDQDTGSKISDVKSPYTVTGLENERDYYFVVTAENDFGEGEASAEISARPSETVAPPKPTPGVRKRVHLKFKVPKGKVAGIMGVINLLQSRFENLEIEIEATDGEMTIQDYEDKIQEAFRQLGIEVGEG